MRARKSKGGDNTMKEQIQIYILIGLPGAGKSTWAREKASKDPGVMIVNKDAIRKMLFGRYDYKNNVEPLIHSIALRAIGSCIERGYDVIVDETNLSKKNRLNICKDIHTMAEELKQRANIHYIEYKPSVEHLKRRLLDKRGFSEGRWIKIYNKMMEAYDPVTKEEKEELGISGHTVIGGNGDKKPKVEDWLLYQRIYCSSRNVPVLAPQNGICFMCNKNIAQTENWVEIAANTHITSCPHCKHSFCE